MSEAVERRYVLAALGAVLIVVALLVVIDLVRDATTEAPPRAELMSRCLSAERLFPVFELPVGSFLAEAEDGGLRAIVETTNHVSVGLAGSEAEARRLEREAIRRTRSRRRVERRGTIVLVWRNRPSPTQRQVLIDCSY